MSTSSPDPGGNPRPDRSDPPADGPAAISDEAANRAGSDLDPPRNGLGVATLALGVSAVLTFWTVLGGILFGIAAAITGGFGLRRVRRGGASNRAVTLLGLVAGVVGLLASVVFLFTGLSALSGFPA